MCSGGEVDAANRDEPAAELGRRAEREVRLAIEHDLRLRMAKDGPAHRNETVTHLPEHLSPVVRADRHGAPHLDVGAGMHDGDLELVGDLSRTRLRIDRCRYDGNDLRQAHLGFAFHGVLLSQPQEIRSF